MPVSILNTIGSDLLIDFHLLLDSCFHGNDSRSLAVLMIFTNTPPTSPYKGEDFKIHCGLTCMSLLCCDTFM